MSQISDNTAGMKKAREYKRLLTAILESMPTAILTRLAYECAESEDFRGDITIEEGTQKIIRDATEDSKRYFAHYQGAHCVPVLKASPLGRKLAKGAFSPSDPEC